MPWSDLSASQRELLRNAAIAVGCLLLVVLIFRGCFGGGVSEKLPDFTDYTSTAEKKQAFFEYLTPRVETALAGVRQSRDELLEIEENWNRREKLRRGEKKALRRWAEDYEIELDPDADLTKSDLAAIKARVDVVPVSLVIAQASLESGWGSSRFSREGNNLFGMRCYTRGCGIIPSRRPEGATFEVTRFDTLADCFTAYLKNLNTHNAYAELRRIRASLRHQGAEMTGYGLAPGLVRYSEEGWNYVSKIQSFIRSNDLD
jgi:Bax protein|tara:strand:+ start:126469 stop:127248 length:780 start_codon:yes stop_codon:yes gene_type:complete